MQEQFQLVPPSKETKVERVSTSEVYLVGSETGRYKRICGSTNTYTGSTCTYSAGYRTEHVGKGFCWLHETNESAAAWTLILRGDLNPDDKPLLNYIQTLTSLSEKQLNDIDSDIMMLYSLAGSIQHNKINLTPGDIDLLRKVIVDISKMKELKSKIEKQAKFEVEGVKNFINRVFSVIVSQLDAGAARRIMNAIMERVILPMEAANELSGDAAELHSAARHYKSKLEAIREKPHYSVDDDSP